MKNEILERCCGNCEWSLKPEQEEKNISEEIANIPKIGDCCMNIDHKDMYVCEHHEYMSDCTHTYAFFEGDYLGLGFFIVSLYNDNIFKFLKIYRTGKYDNYSYGIRVYEDKQTNNNLLNGITYEIKKEDNIGLYNAIFVFAKELGDKITWDKEHKNFITSNIHDDSVTLYFTGNNKNNYIDIKIDNSNEEMYKLFKMFYKFMAVATMNRPNYKLNSKIRKMTKQNL